MLSPSGYFQHSLMFFRMRTNALFLLLILSQFLAPRPVLDPGNWMGKYMNIMTTHTKNGLTVSKEIRPRERILKYVDIIPAQAPNCHDPLSHKTIAYNANALKAIRDSHQHDQQFKMLPFGAVRKMRELRINCKLTK